MHRERVRYLLGPGRYNSQPRLESQPGDCDGSTLRRRDRSMPQASVNEKSLMLAGQASDWVVTASLIRPSRAVAFPTESNTAFE